MTFSPKATPAQRQKTVAGLIAELNADKRPILVGPWRSELGFEASYWLPFLTCLNATRNDTIWRQVMAKMKDQGIDAPISLIQAVGAEVHGLSARAWRMTLAFLGPPRRDRLSSDGSPLGRRQGRRSGMPTFGRSELAQGDSRRVAGIWCLKRLRRLAGGLLDDLPRQLIAVAGTFSRHARIVACLPEQGLR